MKIELCFAEKTALGLILLVALPYFIVLVAGVYFYNNALECTGAQQAVIDCFAQIRLLYFALLAIWVAAIAISGVLIFNFFRNFVIPIEKLSEIASDIAAGKSHPIPYFKTKGSNEVAKLYDVLRTMVESLSFTIHRLEEANKTKSEFISIASHQLRTPLSAIKWLIELLKENRSLPQEEVLKLNDIYESNERLIRLVNDLLNVSRMESGGLVVSPRPVNLVNLINSCVNLYKPSIEIKKQKITVSIDTEVKEVNLDPVIFNEVLNNILENAVVYAPEDSEIKVGLRRENNNYIISVHNEGPAIPEMEHEKLFTKFYRGPVAQKLRPTGSGLGLFIAKASIEAHGGKIWFESPTGPDSVGVTFYVSIPINR